MLYGDKKMPLKNLTFEDVLMGMREDLRKNQFDQIPQLSSSEAFTIKDPFFIVPNESKGARRAVLVGINYVGQDGALTGCHNDVLNIKKYIMDAWNFKEENILVLMDDGYHKNPTRANILAAYRAVVKASQSGDTIFCHYSGELQRSIVGKCTGTFVKMA